MKTLSLIIAACGFASLSLRADLQVMTHVVELPQQRLSELLADGKSGDALFTAVRAEVDAGRAKAVDTSVVRVKSEAKAMLESIHEAITVVETPIYCSIVGSTPQQPAPPPPPALPLRFDKAANSFSTRDLGVYWSLTVSLSGDGNAYLNTDWQDVTRAAPFVYTDWKDELGQRHGFSQPHYSKLGVEGTPVVKPGAWMLLSVQSAVEADGSIDRTRKVMAFVRVDDLDAK